MESLLRPPIRSSGCTRNFKRRIEFCSRSTPPHLHHIRRHPLKPFNRERTPSAPQVLSLAWAFITRLKGTLFPVVLFGDESLGDRLGDPACVRPRQEKAGRIAVGKPPVVSACSSTIRPRDCQPPSLKSLWKMP